jgi:uncharacterized protein YdhG (YjbR/CyaY superfamily)
MSEVEHYFEQQPQEIKSILLHIRNLIKETVPEAEELISYQMPAFKYHGILAWYAPFKKHYSLFVRPQFMKPFEEELQLYQRTKSAIHFPFDQPVPDELIRRIILHIAQENRKSAAKK